MCFQQFPKYPKSSIRRMEADNLFQIRGSATSSDLLPSWVLIRGTTYDSAVDERRRRSASDTNIHFFFKWALNDYRCVVDRARTGLLYGALRGFVVQKLGRAFVQGLSSGENYVRGLCPEGLYLGSYVHSPCHRAPDNIWYLVEV